MSGGGATPRRAYVVDDDDAFRRSLVALLESAGWTVDAFASGAAFAERSAALEPGIVLLDLHLGGSSGLDLIERGRTAMERFAVVMMTGAGEVTTAVRSIKAGAVDFVEKPLAAAELLERLGTIETELAQRLESKAVEWAALRRVESLSGRERDVLERLLSGASNKLIARDLAISPRTVEMHRARMLGKLGTRTTAEALEIGRLAGMTPVASGTPEPI
jgi:two-component system response regulator FixJ